jgi:hypothetical protein
MLSRQKGRKMTREIREILVAILNGHCDLDFIIFYLFQIINLTKRNN